MTEPTTHHPSDPTVNATVMASAGTGKTWLLVTRLTRLLFEGAAPDSILAITFTRKAAAEMQTRLAERLLRLAALDDNALAEELHTMHITPTAETRARARRLYEELLHAGRPLRTTTFHAFCQDILRRFPLEADVPPGFELTEKSGELRAAAWEALVSEASAANDAQTARDLSLLLELCGGQSNVTAALNSFLDHRSDWWAFTTGHDDACGHATARLRELLQVDPDSDPRAELFTSQNLALLTEFRDLLALHATKTNAEHVERFSDILAPDADPLLRYQQARAVFLKKDGEPLARKHMDTQEKKMGAAGEARFLELHALMCAQLARVHDALAAQQTLMMHAAWYRAGSRLLEHYQRLKEEQRLLDFTDLEWRAYRLLTAADNAHWVQYKLDQRIDHLLVDEFQDTNPTQWRLLLPLLQEMAAGTGERARSVFLVGDGKQSIYRFRRAEPRLFHAAHRWLQQHLNAAAYPLHVSYRSAPAIMECVNRVFGAGGPLAGVLDDFTPHDTHHQALWGRVEVLPLIESPEPEAAVPRTTLRNPLHEPRVIVEDQRHLEEGRQIARTITTLLQGGTLIGHADTARPLRYGDVMLLVRKRTHVHAYEQALREAGIPYLGTDRGTLLDSPEVDDMVRLLETLITPYNNLALAQVLRSPLFACSDADLITLAQGQRGAWFERLLQVEAAAGTPLRRAADCLGRWHGLAGALPIHDLLDKVYSEGNVIARYEAAFPSHLRTRLRANLTRFIELALEIDHGRYPSLTRFLARLGEMREQGEAPDEAPAESATDRVRLLTIHAAKGLEAPVVFLADATASGGNDRAWHAQVGWPAEAEAPQHILLVGRKDQQDAFTRQQLAEEQRAEQREAANLLYVALTRARQLLYITGCRPNQGNDLGWYGVLQQAVAEPITSNTMPCAAAAATATVQTAAPLPPAALRQVLQVLPLTREIAPSRSVQHTGGDGSDEDGRLRGIAIHRMLELLSAGGDANQVRAHVAAELQYPADDDEFIAWWQEAQDVLSAPPLRHLFDPACYREAWNEVPLHYDHAGCTVYGLIDRLVLTDTAVVIVDYKTHRQAVTGSLSELAAPYAAQMAWYAKGVRRLWPDKAVRTLLLFTATRQTVEID
ncbi:UvrD-helicase domain-containing protein [Sulfurivermis fontis]|uniref:UvrD-helicase domain-containing protein n=1 Tax=Sulfurivermis fontis TaxID=1972068 RepID=UPI000FD9BAF4|nr:UvrD-helicase domain-containing protein [Sulfurivermis fontis]